MNIPINITGIDIVIIFFKLFGITFSFMYLIFSIVVLKQIQAMSKTIQVVDNGVIKRENLINLITGIQVLISLILFLFSIIVVSS